MSKFYHRVFALSALLTVAAAFVMIFSSDASALPVRLRSEIAPPCTSSSGANFKYADLFASGNIAVQGSYGCRGAFIYDITNPDAPVLASWYNPGNNQQFLEAVIVGNRGYFGSGNNASSGGGVHIVDLTNPYSPVLLGIVNSTNGNAHNTIHEMVVFEQNGATFLVENRNTTSDKTIKIINVTNPAAPVFVRNMTPTEPLWVHAMVVKGNRMFFSGWGTSTQAGRSEIYDITNIATQAPVLLGYITDTSGITNGNNMHSAWPSEDGNWLYSCREVTQSNGPTPGDLRVYDITNPATPILRNSIGMAALGLNAVTPHNPVVHGNYLYVSWYQAGLQVFNISNRANPVRVGQYDTYAPAFAPPQHEKDALANAEPWDLVCGSNFIENSLPTTYDGAWAVYPQLGHAKILIGDLARGMLIVDTSLIVPTTRNIMVTPDGRGANVSIFSPTTGEWQMAVDTKMEAAGFRREGDVIVSADYDGDREFDFAVFRPSTGTWHIQQSKTGLVTTRFGMTGDIPVPADYDGDGKADIAVWRPSTGIWYVMQSVSGFRATQWGADGDKPLTGDYDGDGRADMAVWRSNGMWHILPSTAAIPVYQQFGQTGDRPLDADFDGNGTSDFAVYRPSSGAWYILDPVTRNFNAFSFGTAEDMPVPVDYDRDGKSDIAVFRPSANVRYGINSSTGEIFSDQVRGMTSQMSVRSR